MLPLVAPASRLTHQSTNRQCTTPFLLHKTKQKLSFALMLFIFFSIANSIIMDSLTSSLRTLGPEDTTKIVTEPAKHSASALGSSAIAPQPSLENLPVELQGLILSKAPTLQSLRALVHASPDLHRVYSGDRLRILQFVLGNILEGMLIDALGAYYSGTDLFQGARERSLLWAFIKEHEAKYTTAESDWIAQLSFEDIISLAHFHVLVLEPLAQRYAS